MRYIVAIVCSIVAYSSFAQRVQKYEVFQYEGDKPSKKKLVLTRTFNKKGKPVKEVSKGYVLLMENGVEYACKQDGATYYYYDDTLLKAAVELYTDYTGKAFDSSKFFYFYNSENKLVKEIKMQNLKLDTPGRRPGSERDTIFYTYNAKGKLIAKEGVYGSGTKELFSYDEAGRLLADSIVSDAKTAPYCRVTRYKYTDYGYREYLWLCNLEYPVITEYITDEDNRLLEQKTYFHSDDEKKSTSRSRDWARHFRSDWAQEYKLYDKAVTVYENDRVAKTMYYFDDKLTTTHLFVYKQL
jgi:hypothetical protein